MFKCSSRATLRCLAGRMWPAGRTLPRPALWSALPIPKLSNTTNVKKNLMFKIILKCYTNSINSISKYQESHNLSIFSNNLLLIFKHSKKNSNTANKINKVKIWCSFQMLLFYFQYRMKKIRIKIWTKKGFCPLQSDAKKRIRRLCREVCTKSLNRIRRWNWTWACSASLSSTGIRTHPIRVSIFFSGSVKGNSENERGSKRLKKIFQLFSSFSFQKFRVETCSNVFRWRWAAVVRRCFEGGPRTEPREPR